MCKTTCLICNKEFSYVSNTHLKTHNLTPIEYKTKFPNASFKSEIINKKSGDKTETALTDVLAKFYNHSEFETAPDDVQEWVTEILTQAKYI
jgi:hypothetical protein